MQRRASWGMLSCVAVLALIMTFVTSAAWCSERLVRSRHPAACLAAVPTLVGSWGLLLALRMPPGPVLALVSFTLADLAVLAISTLGVMRLLGAFETAPEDPGDDGGDDEDPPVPPPPAPRPAGGRRPTPRPRPRRDPGPRVRPGRGARLPRTRAAARQRPPSSIIDQAGARGPLPERSHGTRTCESSSRSIPPK